MLRHSLIGICLIAVGCSAAMAQAGGPPIQKKLIEYGWDTPTPAYVRANIRQMEKRPFNGIIMRLAGGNRGSIFSGGKWAAGKFANDTENLSQIKWHKFTDNFIMMYSASNMDWFSDSDWAAVLNNVTIMAKAAAAGHCNLAFDAEPYGKSPWNYAQQVHAKDKTFAQYQAKVRQRGAQFITTIGKILPHNALLTLFSYSVFQSLMTEKNPAKREQALSQHGYGLYLSFLNGMLDAIGPGMSIIDGHEPSYYYTTSEQYYVSYLMMRQTAQDLVPPEDLQKFLTQTQAGQALYMDYVFDRQKRSGLLSSFMTPQERDQWFQHNTYWALKTTDQYVWLYSERMDWWKNKDIPSGMEQAVVAARQAVAQGAGPGFELQPVIQSAQARRKAEIQAKLIRRTAEIPALGKVPPPVIDGQLNDRAWTVAAHLQPFVGTYGTASGSLKAQTRAAVTYDKSNIYISLVCNEPNMNKLVIVGQHRDDPIWNGDSVDMFLTASQSGTPYYHFILNPKNVHWDAYCSTSEDLDYNPQWRSATRLGDKAWYAEIAIPWAAMKIHPVAGLKIRANLCRQRRAARELSSWSQVVTGFVEPDSFGTWVLK